MRKIAIYEGDGMDGTLFIIETNVPKDRIQSLIDVTNSISDVLVIDVYNICKPFNNSGIYEMKIVDSCPNMSSYCSSTDWRDEKYPDVVEEYVLYPCV